MAELRKPEWLRPVAKRGAARQVQAIMGALSLNTVCREAHCPNIGECFERHTATFLILGRNCTRGCRFCTISKEQAMALDPAEPMRVAQAAVEMGLRHVVVTSVTRDDLPDGGAAHFAATVRAIRDALPQATVELLIPDFQGDAEALLTVLAASPDVLGHNVETVPSLYREVRPEADYARSLEVLARAKKAKPRLVTKTGLMVGLGEAREEVRRVMEDAARVGCDILTIGQYLQPSKQHLEVKEYVRPELFEEYGEMGRRAGIPYVFSGPLVRSSYKAAESYQALRGDSGEQAGQQVFLADAEEQV